MPLSLRLSQLSSVSQQSRELARPHMTATTREPTWQVVPITAKAVRVATAKQATTSQASGKQELRICTSKSCKKQGSEQVLKYAQSLDIENLDVQPCKCLGSCGTGPNLVILPDKLQLSHVKTPAHLNEVVTAFVKADVNADELKASQLRVEGNQQARSGNLSAAIDLYTKGLELQTEKGQHLLYANRSGARLTLGDTAGAIADADKAATLAPPDFTTAIVRQVEANMAAGNCREAATVLNKASDTNKDFARSRDFIDMVNQLKRVTLKK